MKKKIKSKSIFQNTLVKAVPLSVALALISAGNIYAAADDIQVDMGEGKIAQFSLSKMSDSDYKEKVQNALKAAFEDSQSILVNDGETWVDFGKNAGKGITLDEMFADEQFSTDPEENPTIY